MNVVNFAEEFTQLISRWTKPGDAYESEPLTNQQIVNVVRDVIQVMLGITMQVPDYSSVSTPATHITVCTPNAPTVPKVNQDLNNTSLARFRSLDTLTCLSSLNANISSNETLKNQEKMEIVKDNEIQSTPEEKKLMSRSSPAIHVNSVPRSDTFVCKEETNIKESNDVSDQDKSGTVVKNEATSMEPMKMKNDTFLRKIHALRECAIDVISQIDDVKKEMYSETTKPIRRLSSIGTFPSLNRSSSLMRSIPPAKLRRSSTAFPGTPTSSKLNGTTIAASKNEDAARRKSIVASKISPTNRALSLPMNKKSPSTVGRPLKNPKYAHVQSTISKTMPGKRKAQ